MKKVIHCSSLPRALSCHASLSVPEDSIRIDETGEYAASGNAVHEMMAALVTGQKLEIATVAEKHGVDPDELGPLYHMGRQLWEKYAPAVTVIGSEIKGRVNHILDDGTEIEIVGTCDVLARAGDSNIIFDWKSGQIGRDCRDQLLGYAWQHEASKTVVAWLRDRVVDVEDVTPYDLEDLRKRLERAIADQTKYVPSDQNCQYCPRRFEPCPALVAMQKYTLAIFENEQALTPEQAIALYPKVQFLEKAIKQYRDHVRELLEAAGGQVEIGDGRVLELAEREKSKLDTWTLIKTWDGIIEDLAPALSASKTALSKVIGAQAERGQKGKTIQAFLDRLAEAGGIEKRTERFIQVRKSLARKEEKDG